MPREAIVYHAGMKRLILALCAVFLVCGSVTAAEPAARPKFPNIPLLSLSDGSTVTLDTFLGRPVLLTFWASWCGPCRTELPELKALYDELGGKGFIVLAVNVDRIPQAARAFVDKTGLALPLYRVSQRVQHELGVVRIPTSILLGPDGTAEHLYIGYSPDTVDQIRKQVLPMLEKAPAATAGGA